MKQLRILPYKPWSDSAKVLARALGGKRVRFNGNYQPRPNHLVVNWGSVNAPVWWERAKLVSKCLNGPMEVGRSSNKLTALSYLRQHDIAVPDFTTEKGVAEQWVAQGKVVVGRRVLNGHGGIGCEVYHKEENPQVRECPLYTLHLRHKREFRIHVMMGQVIDYQEKLKKRGFEERDAWIRNHDKGYVFARDGITVPEVVRQLAVKAVGTLGLDFGAVDIGYREKEQLGYVFEVNTAPGLEGHTIESYVNGFKKELGI